jgi:hypothetical protein
VKIFAAVAVAALLLGGCAKKNDTQEAVKQGVIRDLASKFDMSKMDVIVDSVTFRDNEADTTVTFTVKGAAANQGMTMNYVMERRSDNLWYIKSRAAAGEAANGATGSMPPGHPAVSAPAGGGGANLPPGHPDIGKTQ